MLNLVPDPGPSETLKTPVVDLNVVERGLADIHSSDNGNDNDDRSQHSHDVSEPLASALDELNHSSSEEWETDSLYEEALHFVRDDQLSSGEPVNPVSTRPLN